MIPDCIVWKTLTSRAPNPSHTHTHTHTTHALSLRPTLRCLFHINTWRRTCPPLFYHKHTCQYLHVHATCYHNAQDQFNELHDKDQIYSHAPVSHILFDDFKSSSTQICLLRGNLKSTCKSKVKYRYSRLCVYLFTYIFILHKDSSLCVVFDPVFSFPKLH